MAVQERADDPNLVSDLRLRLGPMRVAVEVEHGLLPGSARRPIIHGRLERALQVFGLPQGEYFKLIALLHHHRHESNHCLKIDV